MKWKYTFLVLATLITYPCVADEPAKPFVHWYLGFLTSDSSVIRVELAQITSIRGTTYAGIRDLTPSPFKFDKNTTDTKFFYVSGKGAVQFGELPKQLFIRWMSLGDERIYQTTVTLPRSARDLMRRKEETNCFNIGGSGMYRDGLSILLAPKGEVQVFVGGSCFPAVTVAKAKADYEPIIDVSKR